MIFLRALTILLAFIIPFTAGAVDLGDPIEFVDYIFDRYAYLKLPEDASDEAIRAEIKKRKVQNHPDRLEQLDESLRAQARTNWARAVDCEEILLGPGMRPLFDLKLREFRARRPHLISTSGAAIINLDREFVDLALLTGGRVPDAAALTRQAQTLTGHDPKEVERARRFAEKMPDDPDAREMLRTALTKHVTYLEVIERAVWAGAGVHGERYTRGGGPLLDPKLIVERTDRQIEQIKTEVIPAFVRQRGQLVELGYDKNPLLALTHAAGAAADRTPVEWAPTIDAARTRFTELSETVRDHARLKADAIDQLLSLSPFEILHLADAHDVTVYLLNDSSHEGTLESGEVVAIFRFLGTGVESKEVSEPLRLADLRHRGFERTTAAVLLNSELGQPTLDLGYAYKRVRRALGEDVELAVRITDDDDAEPAPTQSRRSYSEAW